MKSAPAIAFDYRLSRRLLFAVCAVSALAVTALMLSGLPRWGKWILGIAVVGYVISGMRRERDRAPKRAAWRADGDWRLVFSDGFQTSAGIRSAALRGGWIFLNLRIENDSPVRLVLAPDNCDADTRRRLRVRLAQTDAPDMRSSAP